MQNQLDNRRRHIRVDTELEYTLVIGEEEFFGLISNISLSGAFLADPQPEINRSHISELADLKIWLNHELLSLKCEIVYAIGNDNEFFPIGAGVCFIETDKATQEAIKILDATYHLSTHNSD